MNSIWPEILETGMEPESYKGDPNRMAKLCADGLCGWALCSIFTAPKQFGVGMAQIGAILGIAATGDNLMKYSEKFVL